MAVKDCPKNNSEGGEEVHRRSLREKIPNRWPSKFAQRKIQKLAKKSIEEHSAKKIPNRCPSKIVQRKIRSGSVIQLDNIFRKSKFYTEVDDEFTENVDFFEINNFGRIYC